MGFLLQITHSYPVFKGHVIWLPQKMLVLQRKRFSLFLQTLCYKFQAC